MVRSETGLVAITCALLMACGSSRDARPQQRTVPAGEPSGGSGSAGSAASPRVEPAHEVVSWDHLAPAEHHKGASLYPVRTPGVVEAHAVVAVRHDEIEVYTPSSVDPIASTTTAKLGFEISPATDRTLGTAAGVLVVTAPAREQIVALDATTLVERFTLPAPKGTRVHRIGEAADVIWLDIIYPTGAALVAVDPRTGSERWRVNNVRGALASAGDRILGGSLTAYDARTGAVAWSHATDPDHDTKVVGETFTVLEGKDETRVAVVATGDGHTIAQGPLGRVVPYDTWIITDNTLYASVVDDASAPTSTRLVAWDPQTAKPTWTALDRMSFFAESGLHTSLQATRRELFFLDSEENTITAIDRMSHAVRWRRGFDIPASMVFANDGQAALYVASQRGIEVFRPSATPPALEHATIRGVVTFDQKPRAAAWVRSSCGVETRTDVRGRFTLACDAQGAITVAALVKANRAKGCNPEDARSETIVLEGKLRYEVEFPLTSTCGD
jgi:outer membrane protein assembly factor BamB